MTNDTLIAIQVRLNTALLALSSAIEAAPLLPKERATKRDKQLIDAMLSALEHVERAHQVCEGLMEPMR